MPKRTREDLKLAQALHNWHRGYGARLSPSLCARILGRKGRDHGDHFEYYVDWPGGEDQILCGRDVIWKTGAAKILAYVQEHVSPRELAICDWAEQAMWEAHVKRQAAEGYDINPKYAPKFYRFQQEVTFDEATAVLRDEYRQDILSILAQRTIWLFAYYTPVQLSLFTEATPCPT